MFLVQQVYAKRYRVWTLEGGLCHGEAAQLQEEMEELVGPIRWR